MQYIIDFDDNAPISDIEQYLSDNMCEVKKVFSSFNKVYIIEANSMPPKTAIVSSIIEDTENEVELLTSIDVKTDEASDWWKIASAYKPDFSVDTQTYERRGKNARVYLIDSGVNINHPEFAEANIIQLYSLNGDFTDTKGHGTSLASVIVGKQCGMTDATLLDVKVFHDGLPTRQSHLLEAFDAVIADAKQHTSNPCIVNISWSIPKNEYLETKIRALIDAGVFVICAAGNSATSIKDITPAAMEEVFVVGAYNEDLVPCSFSNFTSTDGTSLDVWAPGENIKVATKDGGYGTLSGTSVAAAIQTAASAYNVFLHTFEDGTIPEHLNDGDLLFSFATGKKGLLILENEYSDSINAITTFYTEIDGQNGINHRVSTKMMVIGESGKPVNKILFPRQMVASTTLTSDDLPEGLRIDGAWLTGKVETFSPIVFNKKFQYTKHNGTVINSEINLLITPENVSVQDANVDEEVKLTFLAACSIPVELGGYWYCNGDCPGAGICYDACAVDNKLFGTGPIVTDPVGTKGRAPETSAEADCRCYETVIQPCGA